MTGWIVVAGAGAATLVLKSVGPALLGGRALPPALGRILGLLAPALLAALVATQVFGGTREVVVDARALGLATAAAGLAARLPTLLVVALAAAVTALARATS